MRHEVHWPFQCQHGDVVTVRLGRELEVRMHVDAPHAESVGGQWLDGRVDHVIAQGHVHLTGGGAGDAVTRGDDVAARDERSSASRKQRPPAFRKVVPEEEGKRRRRRPASYGLAGLVTDTRDAGVRETMMRWD